MILNRFRFFQYATFAGAILLILRILTSSKIASSKIEYTIPSRRITMPYWQRLLSDHCPVLMIKEHKFNSTEFVIHYAKNGNEEKNPGNYTALSGSLISIPGSPDYLHASRVILMPCTDLSNRWCFQSPRKSFVWMERLDQNLDRINNGSLFNFRLPSILPIQVPEMPFFAGPEDARLFLDSRDQILLIFNMKDSNFPREQYIYELESGRQQKLQLNSKKDQKNWTPFLSGENSLYIYSWDPLIFASCSRGRCQLTGNNSTDRGRIEDVSLLRGGSSLYLYRSFYIGLIRTTTLEKGDCKCERIYRPRIVVLSPQLEVIYFSEILTFGGDFFIEPFWPFKSIKDIPNPCLHTRILTGQTLIPSVNNPENWIIELSINDQMNIFIEIQAFSQFLNNTIDSFLAYPLIPDLLQVALLEAESYCGIL